jgi:hypothetical protein
VTEYEWLECQDPSSLLQALRERVGARKLILFSCACVRRISDHHDRSLRARLRRGLAVAEQYADGSVPATDLRRRFTTIGSGSDRRALPEQPWEWAGCHTGIEDYPSQVPPNERVAFLRDIFGNPFRPATLDPVWRTSTVTALARQMYESRDFSAMPILADALQDAGCENEDMLDHCRGPGPHVRGCWVVDLVLGKE